MALVWLGSACGCVRWIGMPPLPPGSFNDTALYGVTKNKWGGNVNRARKLMRQPEAGFDWRLAGTAGESLARFSEVREKFAGVIFVGDSQIREVSWAALRMLTPAEQIRYDENDAVVGRKRASELGGSCVPQSVGKTGFTAECRAGVCRMHSPFHNKSHAEEMRKLLLTRPHDWDGSLSLTEAACRSDFFVSYQATWGAIPVKPLTLPRCMHPRTAEDTFGVAGADGVRKPVLWVMDGGGLHEMEFCDPRRWSLPQVVLKHFSPAVLRASVVWQPVGGGFMMRSAQRYKGACAAIEPEMVARLAPTRTLTRTRALALSLARAPAPAPAPALALPGRPPRDAVPRHARRAALRLHGARDAVRAADVRRDPLHLLLGAVRAGLPRDGAPRRAARAAARARPARAHVPLCGGARRARRRGGSALLPGAARPRRDGAPHELGLQGQARRRRCRGGQDAGQGRQPTRYHEGRGQVKALIKSRTMPSRLSAIIVHGIRAWLFVNITGYFLCFLK